MITQLTDHIERLKALLVQQFKGKTNIEKLLELFGTKVQELEDVGFELINERALAAAIGTQLDNLGEIVGEERQGRSDDEYRKAISVKILINTSSGTPEQVIDIVLGITGGTVVKLTEIYPASLQIESNGADLPTLQEIERIQSSLAATISFVLVITGILSFLGNDGWLTRRC